MQMIRTFLVAMTIVALPISTSALANDKAAVQSLYDFLSNAGSKSHAQAFRANVTKHWQSVGNYSGKNKTAPAFIGQLGFFAKKIPDLNWKVEEMIQAGNRVIVRGRATGTPKGPLFGVDGKGKSFTIMSIDIHTLERGKIAKTYHIEDWAGALRQLKGK
ncbi:MAG: polyketide cyclase [Alphaproteobacteria bacterium]|nr:polyketide cyclase [Alphaproteobacteria bacterium]